MLEQLFCKIPVSLDKSIFTNQYINCRIGAINNTHVAMNINMNNSSRHWLLQDVHPTPGFNCSSCIKAEEYADSGILFTDTHLKTSTERSKSTECCSKASECSKCSLKRSSKRKPKVYNDALLFTRLNKPHQTSGQPYVATSSREGVIPPAPGTPRARCRQRR